MDELQSISYSRRDTLRRCHRRYHYGYNVKLEPIETSPPLRMGSAFSDALEHWDVGKVDEYYAQAMFDQSGGGGAILVEAAKVRVMAKAYMDLYEKPDEREVRFDRVVDGYRDNGRFDGVEWYDPGVEPAIPILIEDKLKGRWGHAEVKALNIDDQVTAYIANAAILYDIDPELVTVKYRVTVKPQHRLGKSESIRQYEHRISEVVAGDRGRFLHEHIVTRSQQQIDEWHRELSDLIIELESVKDRGTWRRNPVACGDFGGCDFIDVCTAPTEEDVQRALQGFKPKEDR